jgi:hypothetical protein
MASTKLTNWIREQIVRDLIAHRFTKPIDKLVKDRAALALKVYRDLYPRSLLAKIEALPEGWLSTDDDIRAQFSGRVDSLPFNGSAYGDIGKYRTKTDTQFKPFLSKDMGRIVAVYEADHPLAILHAELVNRQKVICGQISAAEQQAKAALDSASTVGGIIALWPEIEPFARKHESAKAPLPALPTADLNRLLDLPVAEAA